MKLIEMRRKARIRCVPDLITCARRSALQTLQAMKRPVKCLLNETTKRIRPGGRIPDHHAPTFPFTIGLNAIKGSSAVPVPSVLFKFGAGYRFGKPGTAVPLSVKPDIASPWRAM
jgi:hypothetical protein